MEKCYNEKSISEHGVKLPLGLSVGERDFKLLLKRYGDFCLQKGIYEKDDCKRFDILSYCLKTKDIKTFQFICSVYVRVSGGEKYSFFRKFGMFCFLETPVLRFALLPYYRRLADAQKNLIL